MRGEQIDLEKLRSQLFVLKVFLIFYTVVHLAYLILSFVGPIFFIRFQFSGAGLIIALFHYAVIALFLWFVWKKVPDERKKRVNHTFMIIFLSVIGMWLWFPSEKDLVKFEKEIQE